MQTLHDPGPGKWYALTYTDAVGELRCVSVEDDLEPYAIEMGATSIGDHCWNPRVVEAWADAESVFIDDSIMERLIGRWVMQHLGWPETVTL